MNTSQFADNIAIWTSKIQPEKKKKNLQENIIKLRDIGVINGELD